MQGFLGLSGGVEAGQCSALQPSRQGLLCLPSSSSSHPTSASPFPSSLTTLRWSTQAFRCFCSPGTWRCLSGLPWPPPQVLAVTRDICLISVTALNSRALGVCSAGQPVRNTLAQVSQADATARWEGLCFPCPPLRSALLRSGGDRAHGTASHRDGEMNIPRHQGDLGVTNTECNRFFRSNRKTKGLVLATFPRKTRVTCWEGRLP